MTFNLFVGQIVFEEERNTGQLCCIMSPCNRVNVAEFCRKLCVTIFSYLAYNARICQRHLSILFRPL